MQLDERDITVPGRSSRPKRGTGCSGRRANPQFVTVWARRLEWYGAVESDGDRALFFFVFPTNFTRLEAPESLQNKG
jgi:hypothetical protein